MAKLHIAIQRTTKLPVTAHVLERFVQCTQTVKAFPSGYELSLACVGEQRMRRLNSQYRGKHKSTNVLSFAYDRLSGEVILCPPVIRRQAKTKGVPFEQELLYLLSHGLLHLHGLDHEGSEAEAKRMESLEQRMLSVCYR